MNHYMLYKSEYGESYIAHVLNQNEQDLYEAEEELIKDGFVIVEINGYYLHCFKFKKDEEPKEESI